MATRRLGRGTRRTASDTDGGVFGKTAERQERQESLDAPLHTGKYLTASQVTENKQHAEDRKRTKEDQQEEAELLAQGRTPEEAKRMAEQDHGTNQRGGKVITKLRGLAQKGRAKGEREDAAMKDELSLGGSRAIQAESVDEARAGAREARGERRTVAEDLNYQQDLARDREAQFMDQYGEQRGELKGDIGSQRANIGNIGAGFDKAADTLGAGANKASNILGQAAGTNRLTGTAETILGQRDAGTQNVLAQRAAAMGAAPSYAQLANDAIAAQTQGVQNQTNFAQGQLARRALGAAAGSGEGGALNAQQAMSSLVSAGGDMSMAANLANQQNSAAMRAQAAMAQRGETVGEADYASQARMGDVANASQTRMGAAGTERATDLSTAAAQAGYQSAASVGQAGLQQNSAIQTQNALQGLTATGQGLVNTAAGQQQAGATNSSGLTKTEVDAATQNKATELKTQTDLLVGTAQANAAAEAAKPKRGLFGRRR